MVRRGFLAEADRRGKAVRDELGLGLHDRLDPLYAELDRSAEALRRRADLFEQNIRMAMLRVDEEPTEEHRARRMDYLMALHYLANYLQRLAGPELDRIRLDLAVLADFARSAKWPRENVRFVKTFLSEIGVERDDTA